jgi:hypothetical protein
MLRARLLALLLCGVPHAARAAEPWSKPEIAIEGSIPLYYGDNPTHDLQAHSDYNFSPYFKFSVGGHIVDDVWYSVYASGGAETYYSLHREDDTFASVVTQLSKRWGAFETGVSYARVLYFDGLFDSSFSRANDIGMFARYTFRDAAGGLRIQPYASYVVRGDDYGTVKRTAFQFKVEVEKKLSERWALVISPRLQIYDYFSFPSYRDTVLSISAGLKYELTKNIDLTPVVGYENRTSTLAARNYTNRFVGASLDFSFVLNEAGGRKGETKTGY